LYIEQPSKIGGSVIGLYELVRGLEQSRYEPLVLFHGPNPYREQFRALGVPVFTLTDQAPTARVTSQRRDIAASLGRYSAKAAAAYRLARWAQLVVRRDWPVARRVARLIKNENIDLVHHNNGMSTNRSTIMAGRLAGVSQVCHARGLEGFAPFERYLARSVDTFIYMSTAIEKLYHDLGIPPDKGTVVYDAFDDKVYENDGHAAALRTEFKLADQVRVISNVGRLDWWKGQEYFLQALAEVTSSHPNVKALIVGTPDPTHLSQAYFEKLKRMVIDLRLSDHVIFTGFRSDVPALMSASDIVVHSASEPEPFGRVVVEAMLAGRPVVATAAGGVLDIVKDQVTGLLVPPKDATAMAQAMRQLLEDRGQAETMGQRARENATERFSIEKHISKVQQIYDGVLSTRNGRKKKG
jgi:glycosyltransferase involved in cell wall biosynthesis